MKRLIIMRHAQSSWDNLTKSDFKRHLNTCGIESCQLIAHWLVKKSYIPDTALISSAIRCVQTWENINAHIKCNAEQYYQNELYHSSSKKILSLIHNAQGACIFLCAHNPGVGEFVQRICTSIPNHPQLYEYPPAATAIIDFEIDTWDEVLFGTGQICDFILPNELK